MFQNGIPRYFLLQKWFRTEFRGFSHPKMVRNRIPWVFLFRNGSERNSESFYLPRNGPEWNSESFTLPINGSERNSEGFSLPRNGSEQNSEVFLFHETGIPTELPSVPSCSAFTRKMATLIHGES
jgi:hypothetical protein